RAGLEGGAGGRGWRAGPSAGRAGRRRACRSPAPPRLVRPAQPLLNGATSGLVLEDSPAGFGEQAHPCILIRSGCQKLNLDPVFGSVFGQVFGFWSGMKLPSL